MSKILVTGASGFVGRNICKRLIQGGYDVYGLSRSQPAVEGLNYIKGDVRYVSDFPDDAQYDIVHTAALASDNASGDYESVNILGTKNALSVYPDMKFIHISSSSIYNLSDPSDNLAEDSFSPDNYRFFNAYSYTKAQAEKEVVLSSHYRNVPAISLRPHGVYGKDDTTLLPRLLSRVKNKRLILPAGGSVYHSLTHIDNLTEAIMLGLKYEASQVESFNITDQSPVKVIEAIISAAGYTPKVTNVPLPVALVAAKISSRISEYEVRQIGMNRTYDISKAMKTLKYSPSNFVRF